MQIYSIVIEDGNIIFQMGKLPKLPSVKNEKLKSVFPLRRNKLFFFIPNLSYYKLIIYTVNKKSWIDYQIYNDVELCQIH